MCDHLPMSSYFEEHLLNIPMIDVIFQTVKETAGGYEAEVAKTANYMKWASRQSFYILRQEYVCSYRHKKQA